MFEEGLKSVVVNQEEYKTELARKYTTFLSQFPEIFSDLVSGSCFDFAMYNSVKAYDAQSPIDVFHVYRNGIGIEVKPGKASNPDLQLALSVQAIEKLIQTKSKEQYAKLLGYFYNEPNEENGWIDFILYKRTQLLIDMGYGKFAQAAGILEDEKNL
jgi:hypothetical protein